MRWEEYQIREPGSHHNRFILRERKNPIYACTITQPFQEFSHRPSPKTEARCVHPYCGFVVGGCVTGACPAAGLVVLGAVPGFAAGFFFTAGFFAG